ncbi:MAG: efflux RND transporter periplasmic adaptor subunit [Bacteroidota bacterium]
MRVLMFLILITALSCREEYPGQFVDSAEQRQTAISVRVISPSASEEPFPIMAGGIVGAKQEANLSFKVGGIIDRVYVREGQRVRTGQLLAKLKTTEIDAQVAQAGEAVAKRERDLERVRRLLADSAATRTQLQDLETALAVAQRDLEIAGFNQQYAQIFAPGPGRILMQFAEGGELIGPGMPVYRMASEGRNDFVVRVGVTDRDYVNIALGDLAELKLDAYPGETFQARVSELAAAADPRTGTFMVELTIDPKGLVLRNGFVGRVEIFPSQAPAYVRLPIEAMVAGQGRQVQLFYVDDNGLAKSHHVNFDRLGDDYLTVGIDQLAGIDQIVTDGAAYLQVGDTLNILP